MPKSYVDSRQIPAAEVFDCDLCIIGAGAAGITIAREFIGSEAKVLLLESGGLEPDASIEALNDLSVTGHRYPKEGSRLRFFGGSTNHWGGHCAPMRASVFEKKDWIPYSGWPFGIEELHPYYERAHEIIGIGPYDYRPAPAADRLGLELLPFDPTSVETVLSRYHRQKFGERFQRDLSNARNISVFLHATVTAIDLDEHKRFVRDVVVRTLAGNSFAVRARYFVLATGGIENARVLLLSNHDVAGGLGNQNDLVGRFFFEHIWYPGGMILPADQDPARVKLYVNEIPFESGYAVRCHLTLPEARVRELQIPEYRAELWVTRSQSPYASVHSAARLKRHVEELEFGEIAISDVLNVLADPLPVLAYATTGDDAPLVYGLVNNVEQVPNRESSVSLTRETDALGQRMVELHWRLSDLDQAGIIEAQRVIAQEVGRSGVGRMHVLVPEAGTSLLEDAGGGGHHMGTTRMHTDPRQGVVDSDCRIHGIENIFIAGSSVFPTAGYPNPTLTITALAVRLADRLKSRLATR